MYLHHLNKEQEDKERPVQAMKLCSEKREKGKLISVCNSIHLY